MCFNILWYMYFTVYIFKHGNFCIWSLINLTVKYVYNLLNLYANSIHLILLYITLCGKYKFFIILRNYRLHSIIHKFVLVCQYLFGYQFVKCNIYSRTCRKHKSYYRKIRQCLLNVSCIDSIWVKFSYKNRNHFLISFNSSRFLFLTLKSNDYTQVL